MLAVQCRDDVVRWGDRIDGGSQAKWWSTDSRVPNDAQAGLRGCEASARKRDAVDLSAAVAAITRKAQRASVLRVLAGAHDRDGDRIARGVLDWLVVNRDAHVRPTVANRPFPARLFCEWFWSVSASASRMRNYAA
jgi:hypothetical protein